MKISRNTYADLYGPTVGDSVRLGDTNLWVTPDTLNDNGLLKQLMPGCRQCAGWQVDYTQYGQVDDVFLPHNIKLTNTAQPEQWIKIRISQWTLK